MGIELNRDILYAHFWLTAIVVSVVVYFSTGLIELIVSLATSFLPAFAIVVSRFAKEIDISISDKVSLIIIVAASLFVVLWSVIMFYHGGIYAILIYLITFIAFIGIIINIVILMIAKKKKRELELSNELTHKGMVLQTIIILLLFSIFLVDLF